MASITDIGSPIIRSADIRDGRPRIAGTGVTVQRIVYLYQEGLAAEQISSEIPHLTLGQVYAALAYYHANLDQIDRLIADDDAAALEAEEDHLGAPLGRT